MKRYIYTTLLVFTALFCQAFGGQHGWPTFEDTICVEPNQTINMADFESQILELLQNREDSIWSECCDSVLVEFEGKPKIELDRKEYPGWIDLVIDKNKEVVVTVTYKRILTCSKIPLTENEAQKTRASLAMWHLFGKLLSETDTEKVSTISDVATVTTLHQAKFYYNFELALPENIDFKIHGDSCFDGFQVTLSVDSAFLPYVLEWTAEGVTPSQKMGSPASFYNAFNGKYLYSVLCTVKACKGETRSTKFDIGYPAPIPEVEDLECVAANETSFEVNVNNPNSQLSYYWSVEDLEKGRTIDTQQGASVTMNIPKNEAVRLRLRSTGGCKDAEMEPMILHRSLVSDAHHIAMESEPLCIFEGDTLRFSLPEMPEDTLVWQIENHTTMLPPHDTYDYRALQAKDNVVVSVYAKFCPDNKIMDTFNIREDFKVLIEPNESCISAHTDYVFKVAGNGINPEVHWYGNGIELDTITYSPKDSISLRLTNPGGQNLYVALKAKECGRETSGDTVYLHPRPKKPQLDTLWNALTNCIPLGIEDTIELRVQPQEGIKFDWDFLDNEKFQRIAYSDSHSIRVKVNYDLSDRDTSISISVQAKGCVDSTRTETLYATGAGLGEEWVLIQQNLMDMFYVVGFSDNDVLLEDGFLDPFDGIYSFEWYSDFVHIENQHLPSYTTLLIDNPPLPFDLFCKLTSVEKQCYSIYSIEVVDMLEQQDVLFTAKQGEDAGNGKGTEALQAQASFEQEDTPCLGIVLHPNPVHAGVQVKVEGICETESFTVECYSPQGRCLFHTTAKGDTFTIPTDNFAVGVYIVKIQLDGVAVPIVKKLIII